MPPDLQKKPLAALIERIAKAEKAGGAVEESLAIAAQTINEVRHWCAGIHIMAIGWEKHVKALIERAG